jgi:hypothetical protein
MVVVLGAAALMLWPLLWPSDPDTSVQLVNGRLVGETSGYVGRVDRDARTVDVSSSLVGWRPVVLVVNEHTAIQVQDRPGEIGDLVKDLPVRVTYEMVGDKRLAKSIEVITDDGRARAAPADAVKVPAPPADRSPATPSDASMTGQVSPAGAPAPEAPPARSVTPPPAGPTAAAPPSRAVTPPAANPTTPAPVTLPPAAPSVAAPPSPAVPPPASPVPPAVRATPPTPAQRVEQAAPKAPAPAVEKAPSAETEGRMPPKAPAPTRVETAPPSAARPVTPRPETPPSTPREPAARQEVDTRPRATPPSTDADDGAAAVDWLLKRGR